MRNSSQTPAEMSQHDDGVVHPNRIANLLNLDPNSAAELYGNDWSDWVRHFLQVPVSDELNRAGMSGRSVEAWRVEESQRGEPLTFKELLAEGSASLAALRLVKDYCHVMEESPRERMPAEVCRVIYFSVVAQALVRFNAPISSKSAEGVRSGVAWCLEQTWLTEEIRVSLERSLDELEGG